MLTPRSAARARSTLMRSSGCVGSKFVSTSTTPGISRTFSISCTVYSCSCSMSGPWMRMLRRLNPPPPPPPDRRRPGRAPPVDAPEMSVPPDTLMRAPWYLRSICRARTISSCCEISRSSSGTIMMLKFANPGLTFCITRCSAGRREHVLLDRLDELFGPLIARAARQAHVDAELALVVVGHQLLADVGIEERRRQRRPRAAMPHHHRAMVQRPDQHPAVDRVDLGVEAARLGGRVIRP